MDFGALPPEINSARMYAGAGSAPMMAAAAAWNALAVDLDTNATIVESVIAQLTTAQWLGPASQSMAAAVQPYLAWLTYTAECAQHAGTQAAASAAAFETAFAMTVPPAEIAANRAQLAVLLANNGLGQNAPAIMATEAHYGEMWAQDALAMYGYAASSAAAGTLNPLTTPFQIANPTPLAIRAGAVGQTAASGNAAQVGLTDLIANMPNTMMALASPVTSAAGAAGLAGAIQGIADLLGVPFVQNAINGAVNAAAWFVMAGVCNADLLEHTIDTLGPTAETAITAADVVPAATAGAAGLAHPATPVCAGMGEAPSMGGLSVPASWATAAPAMASGAPAAGGSGWAVPDEAGAMAGGSGLPGIASAAKGTGAYAGPRYGFRPVIMPKQVVV